jgi:hypothetical protein
MCMFVCMYESYIAPPPEAQDGTRRDGTPLYLVMT